MKFYAASCWKPLAFRELDADLNTEDFDIPTSLNTDQSMVLTSDWKNKDLFRLFFTYNPRRNWPTLSFTMRKK